MGVVVLLAVLAGVGSAILRLRYLETVDDIRVGPWRGSSLIGSAQAGSVLRALIAVNGILALNRTQAIYFTAAQDNAGRALDGACRYRVSGHELPARWWSITAYGSDRYLIPNAQRRYSVTRESVQRHPDGSFVAQIGSSAEAGDGIAVKPGPFLLTLRLYGPDSQLIEAPAADGFPVIERQSCP